MADPDMSEWPVRRYRVTVVCLGNICRSPMGEVVLRSRLAEAGLAHRVVVDSAGTGDWNLGQGANPRARRALAARGYGSDAAAEHTSRQITSDWFRGIDLVLAMDGANFTDLERLMKRSEGETELRMMRSFDPDLAHLPEPHPDMDVPDPYYGTDEDFAAALVMIEHASAGLVTHLDSKLS